MKQQLSLKLASLNRELAYHLPSFGNLQSLLLASFLSIGTFSFFFWSSQKIQQVSYLGRDLVSTSLSFPFHYLNFQNEPKQAKSYHFNGHSFGLVSEMNFYRHSDLTFADFEKYISGALPRSLKKKRGNLKFAEILRHHLAMAEKYKVDPFWALSITWTESHFKPQARSRVGAQGLMQIMPRTGRYLQKKLARKGKIDPKQVRSSLKNEKHNIELGMYYLNYLKNRFHGHLGLATIAYNMGPTWVSRQLRRGRVLGRKNLYLDKVNSRYERLTRKYRKKFKTVSYRKVGQTITLSQMSKYSEGDQLFWKVCKDYSPYKYVRKNYVSRRNPGLRTYYLAHQSDSSQVLLASLRF